LVGLFAIQLAVLADGFPASWRLGPASERGFPTCNTIADRPLEGLWFGGAGGHAEVLATWTKKGGAASRTA